MLAGRERQRRSWPGVVLGGAQKENCLNRFSHLGDEAGFRGDPLLYNLVYCSHAAEGVGDAAVNGIIATAHRNNSAHGITGLLFFGGGLFLQWLEGPRANVLRLFQNLEADRRHHDLVVLSRSEEVRERLFGDWDMELVASDDIRAVLLDALSTTSEENSAEAIRRMLWQLEQAQLCP